MRIPARCFFAFLLSLTLGLPAFAIDNSANEQNYPNYQVCFTPGQNCTQLIINLIDSAKTQIRGQIYSFTSKPIAKALIRARNRGVDVQIIYDQSNQDPHEYSLMSFLLKQNIPGYIDSPPGIAHNKVLIIDKNTIETGSFNYTQSAQKNNAENVLIIHSTALSQEYLNNWEARKKQSSLPS